jgi:hypothetical protein
MSLFRASRASRLIHSSFSNCSRGALAAASPMPWSWMKRPMQKVKPILNMPMRMLIWQKLTRYFPVLGTAKSLAILIHQITQLSVESGIKIAQNLFPPAEDTVSEAGAHYRGRRLPDFKKNLDSRSSSVPSRVCVPLLASFLDHSKYHQEMEKMPGKRSETVSHVSHDISGLLRLTSFFSHRLTSMLLEALMLSRPSLRRPPSRSPAWVTRSQTATLWWRVRFPLFLFLASRSLMFGFYFR